MREEVIKGRVKRKQIEKKKKREKISVFIIVALIGLISAASVSLASFTSSDALTNEFLTGDVKLDITEEFTPPTDWQGKDYPKVVRIKNIAKSDSLIRVAIIPRWVDENNNPWAGDVSLVTVNYSNIGVEPGWIEGGDNYFYYNKIVKSGESTLDLVSSLKADIPDDMKSRYKGKTLILDVKAESVQASREAYKKVWGSIQNDSLFKMLDDLCTW